MKRGPKKVVFIFAFARFLYKSIRNLSKIGKILEVHDPEKKVMNRGWVGWWGWGGWEKAKKMGSLFLENGVLFSVLLDF